MPLIPALNKQTQGTKMLQVNNLNQTNTPNLGHSRAKLKHNKQLFDLMISLSSCIFILRAVLKEGWYKNIWNFVKLRRGTYLVGEMKHASAPQGSHSASSLVLLSLVCPTTICYQASSRLSLFVECPPQRNLLLSRTGGGRCSITLSLPW